MRYLSYKLLLLGAMASLLIWESAATGGDTDSPLAKPPNVILIMADDMGYADLSCYGSKTISTPHIDSLAVHGMRLTDYHTNGVVCSPTRASLLTGLYPQEAGVEGVVTAKSHRGTGMDPKHYTLAELLKDAGYMTALFGKWHLGYKPEYGPVVQGFDRFRGFVSGNVDYQSHIDQEGFPDWWAGEELKPETGYLTDIITQHGIRFMEEVKEQPFFLYLAHGAPHYPYQGPQDKPDRSVNGEFPIQGSRKDIHHAYKEMVERLDHNVGVVISYLKRHNLLDNTLIIICSDNGASPKVGSNAPYQGYKGQLYEGGHRVPAIFYMKGVIAPGVLNKLVLSMDLFPTIAGLLNVELNSKKVKLSGGDMTALLTGNPRSKSHRERTVYWRYNQQKAARKGKWKLLIQEGKSNLYHLEKDPGESNDIKEKYPDIYQELKQAIEQWEFNLTDKSSI